MSGRSDVENNSKGKYMSTQPLKDVLQGLAFKYSIQGTGVTNFDGDPGKYHAPVNSANDNIKTAKTAISIAIDKDGKERKVRQAKISSNLLRNAIFKREQPGQSSSILAGLTQEHVVLLIASFSGLMRGYLYAISNNSIKRKSPLMITDALQDNDQVLKVELFSSSGAKSSTSMFERDSIGSVTYQGKGYVDLSELAFVSCDVTLDRQAFSEDQWSFYRACLERKFGTKMPESIEYFTKETSEIPLCEKGYRLPDELVFELVVRLFENIQSLYIQRANAYAAMGNIELFLNKKDAPILFGTDNDSPDITIGPRNNVREQFEKIFSQYDLYCGYRKSTEAEIMITKSYLDGLRNSKDMKKIEKEATKAKKDRREKQPKNIEFSAPSSLQN